MNEAPAPTPASTATQKTFSLVMKTTQSIFERSPNDDVAVAGKDEMMRHASVQPSDVV